MAVQPSTWPEAELSSLLSREARWTLGTAEQLLEAAKLEEESTPPPARIEATLS